MMFPNIGTTVSNMVKMNELSMKWQQRKNNIGKEQKKTWQTESPEIRHLKEIAEQTKKSNYVEGLRSKLNCGKELTNEELEYLKANNPDLYRDAVEARAEREKYKRELENCKTKEEVDRLNINKMNSYVSAAKSVSSNPNIPIAKKTEIIGKIMAKVMGMNAEFAKFVKNGNYEALPSEEEEENKKKTQSKKAAAEQNETQDAFDSARKEISDELKALEESENAPNVGETGEGAAKGEDKPPEASVVQPKPEMKLPKAEAQTVKTAPEAVKNVQTVAKAYTAPQASPPAKKLSAKV